MNHDLIVREPELSFDSLHQELDNFLRDTFFTHSFGHPLNIIKNSIWRPAIEVIQCKENYKVKGKKRWYRSRIGQWFYDNNCCFTGGKRRKKFGRT